MNRTPALIVTSVLVFSALSAAVERRAAFDLRTRAPITYIRDYRAGHLGNDEFLATIAANTPDLLVLGKDAPLHHNWGPVAGTGGENQAYGKGEHIRRLAADELREKIDRIRAMVAKLHDAGVRWVMPYICTMTIGGHHEKRTGFWEFYDHWDEYRAFQLGPRPAADPHDWMQREPDGTVRTYYQWDAPYYAPNYRLAACVNNPAWRQHLANVVRLAAEVGYDGVYMDNNCSTRCYCKHCQRAFQQYLVKRLSTPELQADLGLQSAKEAQLSTKPKTHLWRLTSEFWTDSKLDFLRFLKTIGTQARGADFHIFANTGAWFHGGHQIARVSTVASFIQSEENAGSTGAHPGLVREKIAGPLFYRTYNRRVVEYKFTQSICNALRVTMTTRNIRAGSHWARRAVDENPQAVQLAIAESAAYGGGGAFKMQLRWDQQHAVRSWRAFFQKHASRYEGCDAWAPVGVIAFGEQHYFSNSRAHQKSLQTLALMLASDHVLFDFVHEAHFSLDRLRRFRIVVVPSGVSWISETQLDAFRHYASKHGRLLLLGDDFAKFDDKCRERQPDDARVEQAVHLPASPARTKLINTLSDALGRPAGMLIDPPPGLGVNAYAKPTCSRPSEIILHLVNYNVPLGRNSKDPPMPVEDVVARVPLPPDWRATSLDAFSPDENEGLATRFEQDGPTAIVQIPKLHLYQAIRIIGEEGKQ